MSAAAKIKQADKSAIAAGFLQALKRAQDNNEAALALLRDVAAAQNRVLSTAATPQERQQSNDN